MQEPRKRKVVAKGKSTRLPVRAHLLIVECDAEHLAKHGMDLGSKFAEYVRGQMPQKQIVVVRANSEGEMGRDFANALQEHSRGFRTVLIVGHSNEHGLKLTGEAMRSWPTVGRWLKVFAPDYLFLTACNAGKSEVVRSLFGEINSLREVYGSPALMNRAHTVPIGAILLSLLKTGRINAEDSSIYRLFGYVATGSQVCRWRKAEFGPGEELNSALWDCIGNIANGLSESMR